MAEQKKTDNLNLVIEQIKKQTKDPNAITCLSEASINLVCPSISDILLLFCANQKT